MSARFCSKCGKRLTDDDKFCPSCGEPVPSDDAQSSASESGGMRIDADGTIHMKSRPKMPSGGSEGAPAAGPAPTAGVGTDPGNTAPSLHVPPMVEPQQVPARQGVSGGMIAAMVVIAVAVVAIIIMLAMYFSSGSDSNKEQGATTTIERTQKRDDADDTAKTDEDSEEEMEREEEKERAEQEQQEQDRDDLRYYYDQLSGLDSQIKTAATNFNNAYLSSSLSTRQAHLDDCRTLRSNISTLMSEVEALRVDSDSPYYTNYSDICTLYEDLYNRIDVIVQSWEIDVSYANPSAHQDEITAPIARDNVGTVNRYLLDYQDRYPTARP